MSCFNVLVVSSFSSSNWKDKFSRRSQKKKERNGLLACKSWADHDEGRRMAILVNVEQHFAKQTQGQSKEERSSTIGHQCASPLDTDQIWLPLWERERERGKAKRELSHKTNWRKLVAYVIFLKVEGKLLPLQGMLPKETIQRWLHPNQRPLLAPSQRWEFEY